MFDLLDLVTQQPFQVEEIAYHVRPNFELDELERGAVSTPNPVLEDVTVERTVGLGFANQT